ALTEPDEWLELLVQAPPMRPSEVAGAAQTLGRAWRLAAAATAAGPAEVEALQQRWLVAFAHTDAPPLVLAGLAAVTAAMPDADVWRRTVDALLGAIKRFGPAWWLPIPGGPFGSVALLLEPLLDRADSPAEAARL